MKLKVIKNLIGIIVIIIIFYFMGKTLYQSWHQVPFGTLKFNFISIIFSYGFFALAVIPGVSGWKLTMESIGGNLSFRKSMWTLGASQLAKYIPGHFWAIGGRAYLCRKEGIPEIKTTLASIMEMGIWLIAGLIVFFISIPFWRGITLPKNIYFFLLFIPLGLMLLHPRVFTSIVNFGLKKLGRKERSVNLSYWGMLKILGIFVISWILQGFAFYFLILSIHSLSFDKTLSVIGIYSGAWAIGFLSFITPSGLGVREGVLTFLLKGFIPLPIAILIAFLARIWTTIFDVAFALISWRVGH
ncbi:MAG: lysylphosphatidylglycerol synthase transmembrane domain-containing protein [Candidatus Edwardsbacteria bacterium]